MKNKLLMLAITITSFASASFANPIKVEKTANLVKVDSVQFKTEGHGFPMYRVLATATFGNDCLTPESDEVAVLTQFGKTMSQLNLNFIAVGERRMCPAVYKPVTLTFDLGLHTHPADGVFKSITVNGVKGVLTRD